MPSVTVITPTIGRASLETMISQLTPQLAPGDEHLIIGDGPQPNAEAIVKKMASPYIRYWEFPLIMNYGNPQRNQAISEAKGDLLMFVDDDDQVPPGAIATVKSTAEKNPGRPMMFKMRHAPGILWVTKTLECGHVSGQMFVVPNLPGRVGRWPGHYSADFDFMKETVGLYPEGKKALLWCDEVISIQGYAGPGGAGGKNLAQEMGADLKFLK